MSRSPLALPAVTEGACGAEDCQGDDTQFPSPKCTRAGDIIETREERRCVATSIRTLFANYQRVVCLKTLITNLGL